MTTTLDIVRRYLFNGRHQLITRPRDDQDQHAVSYRTEVCLAYRAARDAGECMAVLDYLWDEHEWAMDIMIAAGIRPPGFIGPMPEQPGTQQGLW